MKSQQQTDSDIVAGVLSDNPELFGVLIDRYETRLRRYIGRITAASVEDIEDLLQDTFIKAYQYLRGFDQTLTFSSWIYRIAHNTVISNYRKKSLRPQVYFTDLPESLVASFTSSSETDSIIISNEQRAVISSAIRSLSQKYQDVIVLYYFEGYGYDEIADILKKPPGTIATWMSRAKKQLGKQLARVIHV